MTGPITGFNQQQIPLSQNYQQGSNEQSNTVRQEQEQQPQESVLSVRGGALSQSQDTNETSQQDTETNVFQQSQSLSSNDTGGEQRRGSVVDIVV